MQHQLTNITQPQMCRGGKRNRGVSFHSNSNLSVYMPFGKTLGPVQCEGTDLLSFDQQHSDDYLCLIHQYPFDYCIHHLKQCHLISHLSLVLVLAPKDKAIISGTGNMLVILLS